MDSAYLESLRIKYRLASKEDEEKALGAKPFPGAFYDPFMGLQAFVREPRVRDNNRYPSVYPINPGNVLNGQVKGQSIVDEPWFQERFDTRRQHARDRYSAQDYLQGYNAPIQRGIRIKSISSGTQTWATHPQNVSSTNILQYKVDKRTRSPKDRETDMRKLHAARGYVVLPRV